MTAALLVAIAAVLAAAAALAPPPRALVAMLITLVLVPGTLPPPGFPGVLTVHRIVWIAALAGVLRRGLIGTGPGWRALAPPPIASRFAVVLGVLAVTGVLLAQPATSADQAGRNWEALAFQLVALLAFLGIARETARPGAGALALVAVVGVSGLIAVAEHYTHSSYTRLWYHAIPSLLQSDEAQPLARRAGDVRVRGAADFTLGFAWCSAAVLPLIVVVGTRARRYRGLVLLTLPLMVLAIYWTYSRSVVAPALVAIVLVVVLAVRVRGVQALTGGLFVTGLFISPSLIKGFTRSADTGSIDVRVQRLPVVGSLAAPHPYAGIGFSGLASAGIPTVDSTYLLMYAEAGVIGVTALIALLLMGTAVASSGVRAPDSATRALGLAYGLGALLLVVSGFTFDAFTTASVGELFWALVALGLVAAEVPGVRRRPRPLPLLVRVGALGALLVVGLALRTVAPTHVAQTWEFDTLSVAVNTYAAPTYTGTELQTTVCQAMQADLTDVPDIALTCQPYGNAAGHGRLRLQAPTRAALARLATRETDIARQVPTLGRFTLAARTEPTKGTATGLRTAPVWLFVLGAVVLLPTPRVRQPLP
jgi:hypothetical protein